MNEDKSHSSNSDSYVSTGLVISIELLTNSCTFVEVDSIEKKNFDTHTRILIVRKIQKILLIMTYFDIRAQICL